MESKYLKSISKHPRNYNNEIGRRAVIIGATGATGGQLIKQLAVGEQWEKITSIARRPWCGDDPKKKINEVIIDSFENLESTKKLWKGHDIFFNCIGTTRKLAGSAKDFVNIEHGISLKAAKLAYEANIPHVSLISASGANYKQISVDWFHPLLYIKTIGQKEQTVIANYKFKRVSIFRPGMLVRSIDQNSIAANLKEASGLGLKVSTLAQSMVRDAESNKNINDYELPIYYIGNSCIKKSTKL